MRSDVNGPVKILTEYPPNFADIAAAFPGAHREGVIFAYHPYVYKPHGEPELPPELVAHEQVHLDRQAVGGGVEQWWADYIAYAPFRFYEEKLAHFAGAKFLAEQEANCNRAARRRISTWVGRRLASPLYSAGISKKDAIKLVLASL